MIEKQETFDTVVSHLRQQGRQSKKKMHDWDTCPVCAYRGINGDRCAAGWLIPDEKYDSSLEGSSLFNDDHKAVALRKIIQDEGHDLDLVISLQGVHDDRCADYWENGFADVAAKFDLTYTPPQEPVHAE